jgi:hypothetical protein
MGQQMFTINTDVAVNLYRVVVLFKVFIFFLEDPIYLQSVIIHSRGPLSLVSTTEELLDRKVAAPV